MNSYTFHINLYDLAFLGAIFIGLNFAVLLWFTKSINRSANGFLALALVTMILWMLRVLAIDLKLETYLPHWDWLPMQFLLVLGPLMYFYVLKITCPQYKSGWKDALHFSPLLLELAVLALEINESNKTGAATYATHTFQQLNPVLQLLTFISAITYLYKSHKLIWHFYKRLQPVLMDRSVLEFRWLRRLLAATALLWCLWIVFAAIGHFGYLHTSGVQVYYPFYILFAVIIIWTAAAAFLKPQAAAVFQATTSVKPPVPAELRAKGAWLKKAMVTKRYYEDPELSLGSLAEKLEMHTHELSKVINTVFNKSFNDLINEYRVMEAARKMQDPVYDNMTLLGIGFEAGFNSQRTFNRVFKEMTGKTPAEYKNSLKKELPNDKLAIMPGIRPIILRSGSLPIWAPEKLNRSFMFKNYLKIAWRNMINNKVYSALNIIGLSSGMAVALLIGLWIYGQYSYDRFLPGYNQLYQVKLNFNYNGEIQTQSGSALPLVDELRKNYPEVKYASETDWGSQHSLVVADKRLNPPGLTVGTDFLKMFPYPLLQGNANTVFSQPNSIILTQSIAKALFGDEDPVNKIIKIDNKDNVTVTGVMQDVPANSTLQFSYLLPYSYIEEGDNNAKKARTDWTNHSSPEYIQLQAGANVEGFENKIKNILAKHDANAVNKIEVVLQPAKNWRLLNEFKNGKAADGFIQYVRIFGIVGILVLVIACINFVNLSTARAEKRAREVGLRKSIGSSRRQLIIQFLSESLLITFIAFLVSIGMVELALPYFNNATSGNIAVPFTNITFWCLMIGYVLLTGLLAGSRPAFYLSSFNPVKVLKGTIQLGKRAALPRQILVVLQFSCSIALIISTLIIYKQVNYAKDRPKGYDASQLLITNSSEDLRKNYNALKNDLLQSGQVVSVTSSASGLSYFPASFALSNWTGKRSGESLEMNATAISQDYFKTLGMTLLAGKDFDGIAGADTANIILNEAAVERLRLNNPLNQLISFQSFSKTPMRVIGVVKNAVIGSPFYAANPAIYLYNPGWGGSIMYRLKPNVNTQQAIAKISAIFNKYNPSYPYDYRFAHEAFNATLKVEVLVGTLASIFAGLAVFISCLGLFGLAAYVAEQRKKEIGIRKVLGASVRQVWFLISGDFILLVVISCVIASPVAFYFLQQWLQNYEYRISIGPGAFIIAAAVTIIITIFTISYQAINSALANPVKSLKSE